MFACADKWHALSIPGLFVVQSVPLFPTGLIQAKCECGPQMKMGNISERALEFRKYGSEQQGLQHRVASCLLNTIGIYLGR